MDNNSNTTQPQNQPEPQVEQPQQPIQQPELQPTQPMQPTMGPQQPQVQPTPAPMPPKQPMSKATKKKIIIISSIIGAVVVIGIVLAILLPNILRIDYGPAYDVAKELKPKIYDLYQNSDCSYVSKYVAQKYTDDDEYAEYISGCIGAYSDNVDSLVEELGNSAGVSRNSEIKTQFDRFKARYDELPGRDLDALKEKLDLYKLWHSYAVALSKLSFSNSTDAEITAAANILINSGNDSFKTYGEGWLEKSLAAANAYREYYNSNEGMLDKYRVYQDKTAEQEKYVKQNKPDITSLIPLDFSDLSEMYSEFSQLYNMIAETYAENYNFGSGDCTEFFGEVYCD